MPVAHSFVVFFDLRLNKQLSKQSRAGDLRRHRADCDAIVMYSYYLAGGLWVGVGGFSKVVASFNHVGGSFDLFMATIGGVWTIPSFRIRGYVLYVDWLDWICLMTTHVLQDTLAVLHK